MNAKKPKKCGTIGCKRAATHEASGGGSSPISMLMTFYLCDEHATTAHEPPLSCSRVKRIEP